MGLVARVLSFVRTVRNGAQVSDVKSDPGGGPNITAEHFAPPGDDAHPLDTDYSYAGPTPQRGRFASLGYVDPINAAQAAAGEKRIYSRDPADGMAVAAVWLKATGEIISGNAAADVTISPDGSILGRNDNGSFELQAGGDFVVNGVTIAANGDVTVPNSLVLAGKEIAGHDHNILGGSSAPGPTGANN